MPADYSRIHRLLKILLLIQAGPGWTAQKLANECGVKVRTIYRDMKMLEGAGIPYHHDDGEGDPLRRGYRVRRDFFMPPVQLTLDESLALIALGEQIAGRDQVPMTRAAARAVAKVRSGLPAGVRDEVEKLESHIQLDLARSGAADGIGDVYEAVRRAITDRRPLECRYESVSSGQNGSARSREPFRFEPYTLLFSQRNWYTVGLHGRHAEVRCLKLNRFAKATPATGRYSIPRDFSLDDHLGNAWRMIRGKQRYAVELKFDASFAETIADTHWHKTQVVEWHDDETITFRCEVDGLDEIVWWVLSMGPHCEVVKPAALRQRVVELAEGVVQRYRSQ